MTACRFLLEEASYKSKLKYVKDVNLDIDRILMSGVMGIRMKKLTIKVRMRMLTEFKANFGIQTSCQICKESEDTQEHGIFDCDVMKERIPDCDSKYEDIFSDDDSVVKKAILQCDRVIRMREDILVN